MSAHADLKDRTNMAAKMIVTMKVMPESPEVNLENIEKQAQDMILSFGGKFLSAEKQPIGFGLVSLIIKFSADETNGSDFFEEELKKIPGVESTQVTMMSRALG